MSDGEQISAVRGTVKNLYKRNEGTNNHGAWSMQNLVITGDGVEMKVVIKDRPALPQSLLKQTLLIQSNMGEKGMSGIKASDNEYPKNSGKITREIYVTPSAHLILPDGEIAAGCTSAPLGPVTAAQPAASQPAAQPAAQPQAQPAPTPAQPTASAPQGSQGTGTGNVATETTVTAFRTFIARRGNAWALCRVVAKSKAKQVQDATQDAVPEDAIQAATASLFISADRAGMLDAFPACNISEFFKKP